MTANAELPLAGVRVLDVTQVWAGPLCVQLLADFGADVIKIESRERAAELYSAQERRRRMNPVAARDPAVEGAESIMRNRRPLSLDISRPEGRQVLLRLVSEADVLVENFTARLLREWGLAYETLASINPRLIMVSMSPAGHAGPWSGVLTYGPSLTSLYGVKSTLGYPGDPRPVEDMSEADPIAGVYGFYAALAALAERDASGKGRHVDLAQGETGLTHTLEAILDDQIGIEPPRGNRHSAMAPQGIYRCAGEDDWISITVEHDLDWQALTGLMERVDLAAKYPSLESRLTAHDDIDAAIEQWTASRTTGEVERVLADAGLAVLPVLTSRDQYAHEHIRARRAVGLTVKPEMGDPAEIGNAMPIKLSATPARIWAGETLFVEPRVEPLRDLIHAEEAEIEALIASGVL